MLTYQSGSCRHPQRSWNGEEKRVCIDVWRMQKKASSGTAVHSDRVRRDRLEMRAERISPTQKAIVLAFPFARRKCPRTHGRARRRIRGTLQRDRPRKQGEGAHVCVFPSSHAAEAKRRRTGAWPPARGRSCLNGRCCVVASRSTYSRGYGDGATSSCCWRPRACCRHRFLCGVSVCVVCRGQML